jgi:anthranilate/para-aminobenzoate synthase component I
MKIIEQLEETKRVYSGVLVIANGDFDFNVVIQLFVQ